MKWALIILAFIATTYFFTSRAGKKEFERGRRIEQIKQEQKKRESIAQASKSSALKFSEKTLATMRHLTRDMNPEVRFAAIELLWQMQDRYAPSMIKKMLETETEAPIKLNLIKMLSKEKSRMSLSLLASAVKDYNKKVKISAIKAISKFRNREAIPILNMALTDYDEEVKVIAIKAIKEIRKDIKTNKESPLKKTNFNQNTGKKPSKTKKRL